MWQQNLVLLVYHAILLVLVGGGAICIMFGCSLLHKRKAIGLLKIVVGLLVGLLGLFLAPYVAEKMCNAWGVDKSFIQFMFWLKLSRN